MTVDTKHKLQPVALFTALALLGACFTYSVGCNERSVEGKNRTQGSDSNTEAKLNNPKPEARSNESKSVDPAVESQIEKEEAEKRATLLKDAQSALEDTQSALAALDHNDMQAALAALSRASGKLDIVLSRDPKLALAPVAVTTTAIDIYTTPDTVKNVVKQAKDDLSNDQVQQARLLIGNLASEVDIHVANIPLATYPAAIRAVAPLIDSGKVDDAKAALQAALDTLVIETYVIPLPQVRAEAMLNEAESLAGKNQDKTKARALVDATRNELQVAEALGYGTKDSYKPIYAQLDDLQKRIDAGQPDRNIFDKLRDSVKHLKFSV